MTMSRESELLNELKKTVVVKMNSKFHWAVANRIPASQYGEMPFVPIIGIGWDDGKNEKHVGPSLYNTREPSTWSGVSDDAKCAEVVVCKVIFDENNSIDDVVRAGDGQCLVNCTWTVKPKGYITKKAVKAGSIPLSELFELCRE